MMAKLKSLPAVCIDCQNPESECVCGIFDAACDKETLKTLRMMDVMLTRNDIESAQSLLRLLLRAHK